MNLSMVTYFTFIDNHLLGSFFQALVTHLIYNYVQTEEQTFRLDQIEGLPLCRYQNLMLPR